MPAERKVSHEELIRLRRLGADGWTPADLAEAFGVTPQHIGRLIRGDQRPALGEPDVEGEAGDVAGALEAFLREMDLSGGDEGSRPRVARSPRSWTRAARQIRRARDCELAHRRAEGT